jgi:tRNA modification GTPase
VTLPHVDAPPLDRASLLTPAGRGAVAVIAAEGPAAIAAVNAHFRAANRLRLCEQPINRIVFGHWSDAAAHREEVITCRTSAVALEIHCHGGVAAAERILAALAAAGCRVELWADWLRPRAAHLLGAEADIALAAAATRRTAAILLDQRQGALRSEIAAIQAVLADDAAASLAAVRQRLANLCDRAALGLHLTQPWQVAMAGRPNVGKSSLVNALVGYQRAIVFDEPGTTRDILAAETAVDGWPVRLTDAAGLRAPADELEAAGVHLAQQHLARADLIVWVLDASTLSPQELADPAPVARREIAVETAAPLACEPLLVVNKIDLVAAPSTSSVLCTCAMTGVGLEALLTAIAQRIVPRPPEAGAAVPFTSRQTELLSTAVREIDVGNPGVAAAALRELLDSAPPDLRDAPRRQQPAT